MSLRRQIESGRWLVGDQDARTERKCRSDKSPLTLAAG
ncbi:hypothetical protein SAMN05216573_12229 [Bradyrhizobium sp. Rc3b]|nr:hypothetical protein SAMN05216573_12229 [Bradyrhizobium sp. Rc3b]